ncbi:aldo/keto reductase [Streptomyces canus]|uniref:aldo/keto reductase n=1 Tax=Streptomyces canus TaxID=58343 RepID=UPI0036E4F14E
MTVHPLGVGCRPIGGRDTGTGSPAAPRSELQDDDARDGLKLAVKRGAAVFDTADIYGLGHSQRLLGQALAHDRDQVCITTRVAHRGTAVHTYAPPHLRHQLEQTLENLQTGYLDVVLLDADSFGPGDCFLNDTAITLHDLRARELVRAVGLSLPSGPGTSDPAAGARLVHVLETVEPEVLATRYNGLSAEPSIAGETLFAYADRKQLPVLVGEPLARGLLTGKYGATPPFTPVDSAGRYFSAEQLAAVHDGLEPLRQHFGDDPSVLARLALRFCLATYARSIVLAGFSTSDQLESNYALIGEPLVDDDFALVDDTYRRIRTRLSAIATAGGSVS